MQTTDRLIVANRSNAARTQKIRKIISVAVLSILLVAALCFLLFTNTGHKILEDPQLLRTDVQSFAARHPFIAPLSYLGLYIILALLVLPLWWLQILAGVCFGLLPGTAWSLIGATLGATLTTQLVRWIAADWFHDRVESRMHRLRKLDVTLGHNGFLVVMTLRLIHLIPFGLSNYAIGLTEISLTDVFIGTFLGSIPPIITEVAIGAGLKPWHDWKFITAVCVLNILLLLPVVLRYFRPQWFRRIGVE